jgi:Lrp/AsnC family transcriptional regulator, leucine-responsive regulatory protein
MEGWIVIFPKIERLCVDAIDKRIVMILAANARTSLKQLAAKVGLASPTVAERLRRLEERGELSGFTVVIAPHALGYTLQAIIRLNPLPGNLRTVEQMIRETPQFVECDRVTGEDCFVARLYVRSIDELNTLLEPFHECARTVTSIVGAQPVPRRLPPL